MARKTTYQDTSMEVTKVEPTAEEKQINEAKAKMAETISVDKMELTTQMLLDTVLTFLIPELMVTGERTSNACVICGSETFFSNRHICKVCMSKHKNEIYEKIKKSLNEEVVKIG